MKGTRGGSNSRFPGTGYSPAVLPCGALNREVLKRSLFRAALFNILVQIPLYRRFSGADFFQRSFYTAVLHEASTRGLIVIRYRIFVENYHRLRFQIFCMALAIPAATPDRKPPWRPQLPVTWENLPPQITACQWRQFEGEGGLGGHLLIIIKPRVF